MWYKPDKELVYAKQLPRNQLREGKDMYAAIAVALKMPDKSMQVF